MPDNQIRIEFKVDIKEIQPALQQAASTVQEHTDDMAKQFKKLGKEAQTALDDLKKAAKLSGLDISNEMESVLEQVPKVAQGLSALFSGGGVLAFLGVLIDVGIALKGLFDDVIALKGAKEEWAEINKRFADAEETLQGKMRANAIEYIRLTQGEAAAAHAALKLSNKEVVDISKNVDQILSGKKIDKLSEGLRKDLENLKHFTFEELSGKIKDVDEAIQRAEKNSKKLNDRFVEALSYAPLFGDLGKAIAGYFGAAAEKAEGELKVLQGTRQALVDTQKEREQATKNDRLKAGQLDSEQQMRGFKQRLQEQKDALDAFHTMSKQDEVKYWDDILATHKLKGQNLKEVQQLRAEAQKEADRQGLADEVEKVQEEVAASKAGSQERVRILNDELARMEANHQTETAEYKRLVKERNQAVQDAAKKELKDEVARVEEQVKETRAGSQKRIDILDDEIRKLEKDNKTETDEYKRLVAEKKQAVLDLARVVDSVKDVESKSDQQHEEALKNQKLSRLDFERQLGRKSESQYEQQLRDEITDTYTAALKELEAKKIRYQQDPIEYAKVKAEIVKLNDKYNTDIEKADQKSYLRRRQQFDQYFKQISSSFNTALNSWIKGTETASQAFREMFQDIMSQLINFVEQWIEKKIEMWLMDKLLSDDAQSKQTQQHINSDVTQIEADAFLAAADAATANAAFGPEAMAEAASVAFAMVSGFAAGAGALSAAKGAKFELGGIVPQTGLALVHKGETILPASMSGKGLDGVIGGGLTVVVNHSVNAVDAESFQQHIRRHGNMIGNEVARVLKKRGFAAK